MRVIVLGAGVIGVSAAYWLARAGHSVSVIERCNAAALETSWGNGGIVHISSVEPWSAPGVPLKVLRWLGDERAPIVLRRSALPHMWRWGLEFLRNCTPQRHKQSSLFNLQLALESVNAIAEMRNVTQVDYDLSFRKVLKIYSSLQDLQSAAKAFEALRPYGLESEVWDIDTCVTHEPALAGSRTLIAGGIFFPQDEIGDCNKFTQGIASWCAQQGVSFEYGTTVLGVDIRNGRVSGVSTSRGEISADAIVVALGSYSSQLLKPLGIHLPLYPVKGVSLTAPREAWPDAPRMALMDDARKVAFTPLGDRLRVVGSAEIARFDTVPDPVRINAIGERLCELLPGFRACMEHPQATPWAGLRPVLANGRPFVGRAKGIAGLWINSGHGHTGWTQAAGSGRRLANLLDDRS
ncbi:D-amino acid dehydrogenase [Mesorhizobium sp. 2RAF21]|uniref:D-amino acid dehydrogenase n=1 Tax=Mesorhizobium sp. 2RAF21 TaxID=3232995 RepID=UPI003F9A2CA8